MMFSWRTASVLIAARTSASPLPVRVPPAARVRSRLRSSSQHSNNCATKSAPVNFVPSLYSFQRVTKYAHSSPVPASNTDGRFSLSARALVDGAIAVAVCAVAWMFRRAAVATASSFSASNVQSGNGHLTFKNAVGLTVAKLGATRLWAKRMLCFLTPDSECQRRQRT